MKFQILIIASTLTSLIIFGCQKSESTPVNSGTSQQIQKLQDNSSADNSIQSQPVSDNPLTKDEQTSASADNSIPAEPVQEEAPEAQKDAQNTESSVVVKMVEYNEYKVTGTRRIGKSFDDRKNWPQEIELKVRCAVDNPKQCECNDGASQGYDNPIRPRIVPCDQKIREVTNIHKHGTINSFEKLLKYVKQSPERLQYAVSFVDINPDNKLPRVHRDAAEIRKLCPVQNGVISEDCECFSAKSHDPDSFLITSGALIKCPESTK